jgi:tetratricopeptide (TPR) repeat protein
VSGRGASRLGVVGLAMLVAGCTPPMTKAFDRGLAAYREGHYREAIAAFDEVIEREPRAASAWANRGAARVRLGDLRGAIADYDHAIELDQNDADLYFNRGNALAAVGQIGQAIDDFTRAIELDPGGSRAYYNRGLARILAGDPGGREDQVKALEMEDNPWTKAAIRRRLGLEPPPPPPGLPAALPLPPAGEPAPGPEPAAAAAADATPVPDEVTVDARALAARGLSRELDGDHVGAVEDLRAALAIEPDERRRATLEYLLLILTESGQ